MEALFNGFTFDLGDLEENRDLTMQVLLSLNDEEEIRQYWNAYLSNNINLWVYPMEMLDDYLDDHQITALEVICRDIVDFGNFFTEDPFFIVDPFDGLMRSAETIDRLVCWTDDDDFLDFVWNEYIKNDPSFYGVRLKE